MANIFAQCIDIIYPVLQFQAWSALFRSLRSLVKTCGIFAYVTLHARFLYSVKNKLLYFFYLILPVTEAGNFFRLI